MHHDFTAVYERDGDWIVAYCPEVPGANGQGRTKDDARASLTEAIVLILEDRRDDGLRGVPPDAAIWLRLETVGSSTLAVDESSDRRGRSSSAPHGDW